jgi:hypothetical protein
LQSGVQAFVEVSRALEGVSAQEAMWAPEPGVHSIWEIAEHVSRWLELALADLAHLPMERRREWPEVPAQNGARWEGTLSRLRSNLDTFKGFVSALSADELYEVPPGHWHSRLDRVMGAMAFCAFHAGRIAKLRALYERQTPSAEA